VEIIMSETGVISVAGFNLRYQIEGSGLPAIVVGSSLYYPRTFSQNLRQHFRFVFMDHRGFVAPPEGADNSAFELDALIDDIEQVRKALNLDKIAIIGHSGHAYMALEYAKKYPQNVSQVILIAFGPNHSQTSHQAAEQYWQDSVCPERKLALEESLKSLEEELQAAPDKRFITFALKFGPKSWYDYHFDTSSLWKDIRVNMQMFDYVWGNVFANIDVTKGLENLDKPVFMALGQYDFLVAPFYTWNPIRSKFKNLTMRIFERSSHAPQFEEPESFDRELLQWIAQCS